MKMKGALTSITDVNTICKGQYILKLNTTYDSSHYHRGIRFILIHNFASGIDISLFKDVNIE